MSSDSEDSTTRRQRKAERKAARAAKKAAAAAGQQPPQADFLFVHPSFGNGAAAPAPASSQDDLMGLFGVQHQHQQQAPHQPPSAQQQQHYMQQYQQQQQPYQRSRQPSQANIGNPQMSQYPPANGQQHSHQPQPPTLAAADQYALQPYAQPPGGQQLQPYQPPNQMQPYQQIDQQFAHMNMNAAPPSNASVRSPDSFNQFGQNPFAQSPSPQPQLYAATPQQQQYNGGRQPAPAPQQKSLPAAKSKPKAKQRKKYESSSSEEETSSDESSEEDSSESEDSESEMASSSSSEDSATKRKNRRKAAAAADKYKKPHPPLSSPTSASPMNNNASAVPTLKVDVLQFMHKGTQFLKYGKHGYPHFRQFQLSTDNRRLMWYSQSKSIDKTQIDLSEVSEIRLGQTTKNFTKHRAPELSKSSFSVMYYHGSKSLDLIAKEPNEYRIWLAGLRELMRRSKQGEEVSTLKTLFLDLPLKAKQGAGNNSTDGNDFDGRSRASSAATIRGNTITSTSGRGFTQPLPPSLQGARNTSSQAQPSRSAAAEEKQAVNNSAYNDVTNSLMEVKKRYQSYKTKLKESPQYYQHPSYEAMQTLLKRVQESINKAYELLNMDKDYQAADDLIWKADVDLQSLRTMMKAIR